MNGAVSVKPTPMMQQWFACKKKAKQALLLFQMGEFYEAFYEDAEVLAKELELTLTERQQIPMSGVPCHTSENYVHRLVAKGYRVAIANQMEDPQQARGLVKREVVRVVSPGTILSSDFVMEKKNNFFFSLVEDKTVGFAALDMTTGEFYVAECQTKEEVFDEIARLRPAEFLLSHALRKKYQPHFAELKLTLDYAVNAQEAWYFEYRTSESFLKQHFAVHTLDGSGLKESPNAIRAAGSLLLFLKEEFSSCLSHVRFPLLYHRGNYLHLDQTTQRNLELTESLSHQSEKQTLFSLLDKTKTPMGGRLLRRWIKQPLRNVQAITTRQQVVQAFFDQPLICHQLQLALKFVRDLERLTTRLCSHHASPKEMAALAQSLLRLPTVKECVSGLDAPLAAQLFSLVDTVSPLAITLSSALVDDPPLRLGDKPTIRPGYDEKIDEWRTFLENGESWLKQYQETLREETGIRTVKVGYNRVFGYYIDVSKGQAGAVPPSFIRKQTLTNSERFIAPELKEYEEKTLRAKGALLELENAAFSLLQKQVVDSMQAIFNLAQEVALVDVLLSFACLAREKQYVCPLVDESDTFSITKGRHPVVESLCSESFIANDLLLHGDSSFLLLTGPNMGGKSTYIRQAALIAIMAQMGSFVPAKQAHIGIIDRIFTRIGASDNLARGQSTFMVEMSETAQILHHATKHSLVILDEIGRGTSTCDGIAIAWAVAEHLLKDPAKRAKTLFATHYLELTELEEHFSSVSNHHVLAKEEEGHILFLHKVAKGKGNQSYGIQVAQLAGFPPAVISRAQDLLKTLTSKQ